MFFRLEKLGKELFNVCLSNKNLRPASLWDSRLGSQQIKAGGETVSLTLNTHLSDIYRLFTKQNKNASFAIFSLSFYASQTYDTMFVRR